MDPETRARLWEALLQAGVLAAFPGVGSEVKIPQESIDDLIDGVINDIVKNLERQGLVDEDATKELIAEYLALRLFPRATTIDGAPAPESAEAVRSVFGNLSDADVSQVESLLEPALRRQEAVIVAFPASPLRKNRLAEVLAEGGEAGLWNQNIREIGGEFFDKIRFEMMPAWEDRIATSGLIGDKVRQTFNDQEIQQRGQPGTEGQIFQTQTEFELDLHEPTRLARITSSVASLIKEGSSGESFRRAYRRVLAALEIESEGLDEDVLKADANSAQNAFDDAFANTNDLETAIEAVVTSLGSSALSVDQRSAQAKVQAARQEFIDKFGDRDAARGLVDDWVEDRPGVKLPEGALGDALKTALADKLTQYAEAFDVEGNQDPIDPMTILDRHADTIIGLQMGQVDRKQAAESIAQIDSFNEAFPFVEEWLARRGITLPPELQQRVMVDLAEQLRMYAQGFDLAGGEQPLDPIAYLDQAGLGIAEAFTAGAAVAPFGTNELDTFLFSHNIPMTVRDRFDLLNRVAEVGQGQALDEVLANRQRYELVFENEQMARNPVAGIYRKLLRSGVINDDSSPEFRAHVGNIIAGIAQNTQDEVLRNPTVDVNAFVQERLDELDPEDIEEKVFQRRQNAIIAQGGAMRIGDELVPQPSLTPGIAPTLGGTFEREPDPQVEPTVLQGLFKGIEGTPGFLNFLFQQEPQLLKDFQKTQIPSVDPARFDERFKTISAIGAVPSVTEDVFTPGTPGATPPPGSTFTPGTPGTGGEFATPVTTPAQDPTFTTEEAVDLARRGAKVTPPTAEQFLTGRIPGLKKKFSESEAGQLETKQRLAIAEQQRERMFQRSLLGGRTILTRTRR